MSGDETEGNLGKGKTSESSTNDIPTIGSSGNGLVLRKETPLSPGATNGMPPIAPKATAVKDTCTPQLKPGVQSVSPTKGVTLTTSATLSPQSASTKKSPPVTPRARKTARNPTRPHTAPSAGTQNRIAAVGLKTSGALTPQTNSTPLGASGLKQAGASGPKQAGGSGPKHAKGSGPKQAGASGPKQPGGSGPKQPGGSGPKQAGPKQAGGSGPKQAGGSGPKQAGGSGPKQAGASGPKQAGGTRHTPTSQAVSGPKPGDPPRKQESRGASKTLVNSNKDGINGIPSGPIKVGSPKVAGPVKSSPKVAGPVKSSPRVVGVVSSASNEAGHIGGATTNTPARTSAKRSPRRRRRTKSQSTKMTGLKDKQAVNVGAPGMILTQQGPAGVVPGTGVVARAQQQPAIVRDENQMEDICRQLQEACVVTTKTGGVMRPQHQPVVMSDQSSANLYHRLREVEQHPAGGIEGLWVDGPDDCGEIYVGMETSVIFKVINDSEIDRELQSFGPVVPNSSIVAMSSCCPCSIPGRSDSTTVIVSMTGSSSQILHNYICFNFDGGTKLYHKVHLIVTSAIVESLVPDGVYEPRRQPPVDYRDRLDNALEGVKPPCPPPPITPDTKSWFDVPKELRAGPKRFCLPYLAQPLTLDMYSTRFDVLLWLEELSKEKDVRQYDMSSVSLFEEDDYLCLEVPGLAKRKHPVMIGDKLIFSTYKPEEPADASNMPVQEQGAKKKKPLPFTRDGEHYSAYVHKICLSEEVLKVKFMPWFHESEELCGKKYEVMFTINRVTLMRMHDALDAAEAIGNYVLFPTIKPPPPPPSLECAYQNLQFINTKLNPQQKRAVEAIVSGACRPIPYILFGPPGTGKTVTVVESILQIYKRDTSCKILACAPSNSAADLLAERLHGSGCVDEDSMLRLNAAMRSKELLSSIRKYSMATNDVRVEDAVMCSRIIVCTCSTAAVLDLLEMRFPYVFVDEAGQALEPECLIPVSLLDEGCGQLVLAGDPLQLGPVVFSSLASDNGLSISMLERLMGREPYKRNTTAFAATGNYDSMVVTKLVENYRSHGTLLKLYSDQFYDGELMERADPRITHSFCNWEHLPAQGIPLLFHGIQGAEKRERGSPSWFNAFEAEQVLDYAKKLVFEHSVKQSDVGIIAPYNKQVEKIRFLLDREGLSNVKVGSVEVFQGRENLVIIISTVRSSSTFLLEDIRRQLGFVSSPKRFNVAISRAQALLIVVGNPHLLAQGAEKLDRGSPSWFAFEAEQQLGFVSGQKRFNVAISRAQVLLIMVGNPHLLAQICTSLTHPSLYVLTLCLWWVVLVDIGSMLEQVDPVCQREPLLHRMSSTVRR
ncbi:hypothetical protein EMCRGX_G024183 [Ephydatia muelleri]